MVNKSFIVDLRKIELSTIRRLVYQEKQKEFLLYQKATTDFNKEHHRKQNDFLYGLLCKLDKIDKED